MLLTAFKALRLIVTVGWAIYPIGGLLEADGLNITYNIVDLINKAAFGLAIWAAAVSDSNSKLLSILKEVLSRNFAA